MYRFFILFLTAVALAAPASGLAQRSTAERDRERERARIERDRERAERDRDRARERADRERAGSLDTSVVFDGRGSLTVTCPGGAVIVTGTERNEIRVKARTDNGAIRFSSNGTRAVLEPASGRGGGCSDGRFEVSVPFGTKVAASTWSGSVSVRAVRGDLDVHAQSGDVDVRDAGDRLDIETLSGDVVVSGVRGESKIQTISGDLTLTSARGNVEVETVSGDLDLRDVVAKQVRTHTTSGDVSFTGQILDGGRYEFNTHSGEIDLQLPGDIGAELSISTFSGGIESDFPITLKAGEHGIGAAQAKRLTFTVGHGTARIVAETFSGDITLRRRQ